MAYSKTVLTTFVVAAIFLAAGESLAKGKPKGAKRTDPQTIAQLYSGKTTNWRLGGSFYWAPNGTLQGIGQKEGAVGIGRWYVTNRGKLCNETDWYWFENGARQYKRFEECWEFVTAPDGTIWERFIPEKSNWYRHSIRSQVRGNPHQRKFNKLKKDLGL